MLLVHSVEVVRLAEFVSHLPSTSALPRARSARLLATYRMGIIETPFAYVFRWRPSKPVLTFHACH